jgi:hypothetical protein
MHIHTVTPDRICGIKPTHTLLHPRMLLPLDRHEPNAREPPRLLPRLIHRFITSPWRILIALPLVYTIFPV